MRRFRRCWRDKGLSYILGSTDHSLRNHPYTVEHAEPPICRVPCSNISTEPYRVYVDIRENKPNRAICDTENLQDTAKKIQNLLPTNEYSISITTPTLPKVAYNFNGGIPMPPFLYPLKNALVSVF